MIICLVTDRRRADVLEQARRAADAGIDLFQVRERDLDGGPLAEMVDAVLRATAGTLTRVVVNDRLDVAVACDAGGVHLRGDSVSIVDARALGPPPFLVGRSVHSAEEAGSAAGADYLIAGTVFPTRSKPAAPRLDIAGLRRIAASTPAPVLAIGGVGIDRLSEIAAAGAAGFAAISLFHEGDYRQIVRQARAAFDRPKARP